MPGCRAWSQFSHSTLWVLGIKLGCQARQQAPLLEERPHPLCCLAEISMKMPVALTKPCLMTPFSSSFFKRFFFPCTSLLFHQQKLCWLGPGALSPSPVRNPVPNTITSPETALARGVKGSVRWLSGDKCSLSSVMPECDQTPHGRSGESTPISCPLTATCMCHSMNTCTHVCACHGMSTCMHRHTCIHRKYNKNVKKKM